MSDYGHSDFTPATRLRVSRLVPLAIAFVGGLIAMGWALTRWDAAAPFLSWMRPAATPVVAQSRHAPPAPQQTPAPDVDRVAAQVSALEARLDSVADRAASAAGNADRAESLMIAFAARRALDRGLPLGYAETLLRAHFADSQPQAVATIISAARRPVTRADLETELDAMAPLLAAPPPQDGWWASIKRQLGDLVVVRRTDLPSATAEDALARARRDVRADRVDRALAEVSRLPARKNAESWIAKAHRYIGAHDALDRLETEILLGKAPPRD